MPTMIAKDQTRLVNRALTVGNYNPAPAACPLQLSPYSTSEGSLS